MVGVSVMPIGSQYDPGSCGTDEFDQRESVVWIMSDFRVQQPQGKTVAESQQFAGFGLFIIPFLNAPPCGAFPICNVGNGCALSPVRRKQQTAATAQLRIVRMG
jgi:hypothetical protein